jgi:uncharacterized protein (TIGR02302 family)
VTTDESRDHHPPSGGAVLARALQRARLSILWERLWPALASAASGFGLFLAVSWMGLWLWLPPIGRAIGLFLFLVLCIAATVPLFMVRVPSKTDGLRRLDRMSNLAHRPATTVADKMAAAENDLHSVALWRAHVSRALHAVSNLKAGIPVPGLSLRDPFALRALVLILVVATFFAAGDERGRRIAAAFNWSGAIAAANHRIDAWVAPPAYTGRPPIILPGLRQAEITRAQGTIAVPTGSVLVVRASGTKELSVVVTGELSEAAAANASPQAPAGSEERRFVITGPGTAKVRGNEQFAWSFTAIPDSAPTIALTKEPEPQGGGSLLLAYKIEDDYGVVDAQAMFTLKPPAKPEQDAPRPLFAAPDFTLVLPHARTKNGAAQTIKDLTEHPWAGVDVVMTLVARDEANNEGRSEPHEMRLPERPFVKPLARALVEQRRALALDARAKKKVLTALDALSFAPERFIPELPIYLGLRSIYWHLARAESDDALREVVTRLWQMAVFIEDGNVSEAEQALRAAQEALRQALERGASEEEIKRLMEQLRAALDRYMQALAEELRRNPQLARPLDQSMRQLRSQDLRRMLDQLERQARSGNREAARRLLEELQQLLENLQLARPGMGMDGEDGDDMMSALDELADMIRKQQQLRDRTFRQGQDQRRQRGQGRQGDPNAYGELRQNQQALREQLNKLLEELRKRGFPQPGQQGRGQQGQSEMDQLGRAGEAMGDAEGALGDGNADGAVESQGRALEALRRGAQSLAQSMQQNGYGLGPGQPGNRAQSRANQDTDPLGRPLRGRDYGDDTTVKVPGEIDVQRARRILEELRRRFGETFRPQLELEYIERLLKGF